tara:strand:- start:433 stop:636 length:204 start_codon:yes stop_codon:yes gene_type:complete
MPREASATKSVPPLTFYPQRATVGLRKDADRPVGFDPQDFTIVGDGAQGTVADPLRRFKNQHAEPPQ